MKEDKKGIFFDLDDTLYDHLIPFRDGVIEVFGAEAEGWDMEQLYHRLRVHSDSLWPQWISGELSLEEMRIERMIRTFQEIGMEVDQERAARIQAAYLSHQYEIHPYDGAVELIQDLKEAGYTVGIITNGPVDHQWGKIRGLGLDQWIEEDYVFISDALGMGKPQPELFSHVNQVTGTVPEHSCYIGDSWQNDVIGALGAGWQIVWFNPRGRAPESEHQPHHMVTRYAELREILLKD